MNGATTQTEVRHFRDLYKQEHEANKQKQLTLAQISEYVKSYENKNIPSSLIPILKILKEADHL